MENFRKHSGLKRSILIVEDEAVNRDILGFILEDSYDVSYAENGQIALDMIRASEQPYSLILLDLMMPVMDGYTLLSTLKEDDKYKYIPVIVLTAEKNAEVKSIKLGAADFIKKPYDMPEVIMARCERIIELYEDQKIIRSTERDELTGLYSRNFFYEYVKQIEELDSNNKRDALVLNVDHFRLVNEIYGHEEGDRVLRFIADSLKDIFAEDASIICRSDADNFYISCIHRDDYRDHLERIQDKLDKIDISHKIRIRAGVNINLEEIVSVATRFDRAKAACDRIRGDFTRNIAYYSKDILKQVIFHERLINEMGKGMEDGDFVVYFQPKYLIKGDEPKLTSAEALIRWKHPELGMINPGEFIPLFENNGLIQKLDNYVWSKAAAKIRDWKDRLGVSVPVSVNVSRIDIYDSAFEDKLMNILKENDITPEDLLIEITESAYSENAGGLLKVVNSLRNKGFRIEMDDFGSGYSSLNMLTVMPIDIIKMDIGFIRNMTKDEKSKRLVELIINIAQFLKLRVVAEGVEDKDQLEMLKGMGCDIVQGFYFSKPLPAEEFEALF
ncbi:MAG: EAL domain-containing protein [Lachnospiraceae bacterium]|nr:EAL domain-containing protein [Lachnospiraceae bacterium]